MIGRRFDNPGGVLPEPGDYGRDAIGAWYGCSPNGHGANLSAHQVVEHEDGTITVTPSIGIGNRMKEDGVTPDLNLYHGFLERGIWRDA